MNKRLFRLVFNRRRGLLMAVAETTSSQGKAVGTTSSGQGSCAAMPAGRATALVSSLWFAGLVSWGPVQAQIVADPNAPGAQRPTVLTAPNGTPLVNIQTPSAAGVSRNAYQQFDVNSQGAILNNSRTHTQTQLGGWVQGNPWLATGSARVILNEVNSANPSHLRGPIEVAGQRAEVVIANPAGIQVNGGGFLNASRVTLTTGTPIVSGGALDGFRVTQGQIRIEGAGLDASQADHATLLARAVQVNAGIWARELTVSTGAQQASASTENAAATVPLQGTGQAPGVTLDVAQLGGMYAGKIVLVGTEAGLGVRNAGVIAATEGDLVVRADGWLDNRGHLQAQGDVAVQTSGALSNSGSLYAHAQASIESRSGIVQTAGGTMAAGGSLALRATAEGAQVTTQGGSVLAAGMTPQGQLTAPGQLTVQAAHAAQIHGQALANEQVSLSAAQVSLANGQIGARQIQIHATDGDIDATGATLAAQGPLSLEAARTLRTDAAQVSADTLELQARDLSNVRGELVHSGGRDLTLRIDGVVDNREGRIATAGRNLEIQADRFVNVHGRIEHAGDGRLTLRAGAIDASHGLVATASQADIQADTFTHDGAALQAQGLRLQAQDASNRGGDIALSGAGASHVAVSNGLDNTGGSLAANGRLDVTAGSIGNAQGSITALNTLTVQSTGRLDNAAGELAAGGSLSLDGAEIANTGGRVQAGSDLRLQAERFTHSGHVVAGGNVDLRAVQLHATASSVIAAGVRAPGEGADSVPPSADSGHLRITASDTLVAQGRQIAAGQAHLQGASIDLTGGLTTAQHIEMRSAGAIVTDGATVSTPGRLLIAGQGAAPAATLSNVQGVLNAGQLALGVNRIDNTRGEIVQTGSVDMVMAVAGGIDNSQGRIAARGEHLAIQAGTLVNRDGSIEHHGNGTFALDAGSFDGQGGQVFARAALDLQASAVQHDGALIEAQSLRIQAGTLSNQGGAIVQVGSGTAQLAVHGRLDNTQGTIASQGALDLAAGTLHNDAGRITVAQDLVIEAGALANTGTLYAGRDQQVAVSGRLDNTGVLAAQRHTEVLAGELQQGANGLLAAGLRTDGALEGGGHLDVRTAQTLASQGQALASAAVSLDGAQLDLRGSQVQGANLSLTAGEGPLDTRGALVATTGQLHLTARGEDGLLNAGGTLSAGRLVVDATRIDNTRGVMVQTGHHDLNLQAETVNNTEGRIASAGGNLGIQAQTLDNTRGAVHATAGSLWVEATEVRNLEGGQLHAAQSLTLDARQLNNGGSLYAGTSLDAVVTQTLTNRGVIAARGHLTLDAGRVESAATGVLAAGLERNGALTGSATLAVSARQDLQVQGQTLASGAATLTGASVDLSHADARATSLHLHATQAGVLTRDATVVATGALNIQAAASLDNTSGLLAGGQLHLDARDIDNRAGEIVQTGRANAVVSAAASLDNSHGRIALNADEARLSAATLTNTHGRIEHAGAQTLHIEASTLQGEQGLIESNARLELSVEGTARLDGAETVARQLSVDAGSLSHRHAVMLQTGTGPASVTATGAIDNTGGTVSSNGSLALHANTLTNQGGALVTANAQRLDLTVSGALDNTLGQMAAGGDAALSAGRIDNTSGRITAAATVSLQASQDLDNASGVMAARSNVSASASTIDNTQGTLASVQAGVNLHASGLLRNDAGRIEAAGAITLESAGLSNTLAAQSGGRIIGQTLQIDTRGQALDNTGGTLAARGEATLDTGTFHNTSGLVQSGGHLRIDTHHQVLINALTNSTGDTGLVSGGEMTLLTGALDNDAGFIGAAGDLTLRTQTLTNTSGALVLGQSGLDLQATGLDNRAGQVQVAGSMTLDLGNGTLDNRGSLLRAGDTLRITAATIDNRGTLGSDQGIEAADLHLATATLRNAEGALRADSSLAVASQGSIDNTGGLITSLGEVALIDAQADRTLSLTNEGGTVSAGQSLQIQADRLTGTGRIVSGSHASVALDASLAHTGEMAAAGHLQLTLGGALDNSGHIEAGGQLQLNAASLDNRASGEIIGHDARLTVEGAFTNRGLVDGAAVRVQADTLHNLGTGRLYGNHLALQAVSLTNDTETLAGVRADAVIAARERLDIGATTLVNREHALLFSAGDMALGGSLDANGRAAGRADLIHNASATIEALGNVEMRAAQMLNANMHFSTTLVAGASTPALRLLHNGVQYEAHEIATNFGALNQYLDRAHWRVLLPSEQYPFDRFPADVASWAVPAGSSFFPFMIATSQSCLGADSEGGCSATAPTYADNHGIWQRFGVAPPPAYDGPICDSEINWCTPAQWTTYQQAQNARMAAYQALDAQITAYNQSIPGRLLREWTVLDVTRTVLSPEVTSSDPGLIRVGGHLQLDATVSAVNDKSQIIVGGNAEITGQHLQSLDAQALATTRTAGHAVQSYIVTHTFRSDDRRYRFSPYEAEESNTVNLPVARFQTNTSVPPAHAAPEPRSSGGTPQPVQQGPSLAHASVTQRAVITEVPAVTPAQAVSRNALAAAATGVSAPQPGAIATAPAGELGQVPDVGSSGPGGPGTPSAQPVASAAETVQALAQGAQAIIGIDVNRQVQAAAGPTAVDRAQQAVIRTVTLPVSVPTSSLFRPQPEPGARYLIETDPRFTDHRQWLGSDYLMEQLQFDPAMTQKRLGDGFYEQRLVAEQVAQLTGRRFLDGHADDEAQMRALMDAGLTFAHEHALRPGI
ncbi:MAG: filamentous hemagglutinin N-terminal domain-containing protein, partial [Caldimonas sp.]|uniref:two-partner secretion domain-containing protein n=1 Tax=Caldimonas sp. TaxID=2838790 RepID=UPI00391ADB01